MFKGFLLDDKNRLCAQALPKAAPITQLTLNMHQAFSLLGDHWVTMVTVSQPKVNPFNLNFIFQVVIRY